MRRRGDAVGRHAEGIPSSSRGKDKGKGQEELLQKLLGAQLNDEAKLNMGMITLSVRKLQR